MDNSDNIQFEERNVSSAVTWGIIFFIVMALIYFLSEKDYDLESQNIQLIRIGSALVFLICYIIIVYWVIKIAKKVNRDPIFWGILSLVFGPTALIAVGFMDYKINDKRIKHILDELRLDFNTEYLHIKSTKDLTREELAEVELKLKEKFKQKLKERISESNFKGFSEPENMTELERAEEEKRIEAEEDDAVQAVSDQHWTGEANRCPACGAAMGDNITTCPECGLTISKTDE
jgi:rubrerythrin